MTAEIIEFPMSSPEDRLMSAVVRLEQIVREVERIALEQPAHSLHRLLTVMEHLGDGLVESSALLLDHDANGRIQTAFASLCEKIAEAREALAQLRKSRDR